MTTPINALPYPNSSSPNNPPIHFQALNNQLDTRLVPQFSTTTARNSAITSPVNGMMCAVAGYPMVYRAGDWHGINSISYATTTVNTALSTVTMVVMTINIPDPQFPYRVMASGSLTMSLIGASVSVQPVLLLNGSALPPYGPVVTNPSGTTDLVGAVLQTFNPGMSAVITGASTLQFQVVKQGGPAGNGFKAGAADNGTSFWAQVIPV